MLLTSVIYEAMEMDRFLVMHMPTRRHKHLSNKYSAAAEEWLDYIEDVHLREHKIHLYIQYSIVLMVSERKWLSNNLQNTRFHSAVHLVISVLMVTILYSMSNSKMMMVVSR